MPVESKTLSPGQKAPDFELNDVYGKPINLHKYACKDALVIMFLCGHCPYVQALEPRILDLARELQHESVQFLAICSNDFNKYPEDSPEALRKRVEEKNYSFPYLVDENQEVAKSFDAVCTPEFYVFDQDLRLAYHGRFDDNWKEPEKVESEDLRTAIYCVIRGKEIPGKQIPSIGCSIKWKDGNL
jgi:peroxiredoxin